MTCVQQYWIGKRVVATIPTYMYLDISTGALVPKNELGVPLDPLHPGSSVLLSGVTISNQPPPPFALAGPPPIGGYYFIGAVGVEWNIELTGAYANAFGQATFYFSKNTGTATIRFYNASNDEVGIFSASGSGFPEWNEYTVIFGSNVKYIVVTPAPSCWPALGYVRLSQ